MTMLLKCYCPCDCPVDYELTGRKNESYKL